MTGLYLTGIFRSRHDKQCKVKMVLDTGNLNENVMSYQCAKDLGLEIQPTIRTATGVDGSNISILGQVGPLEFSIEQPCKREFKEKFIVINKMSIPINLSSAFMMKESIECKLSPAGNVVCIGNYELPLNTKETNVNLISFLNNQPNKEFTFQEDDNCQLPGLHQNTTIPVVQLGPQKVKLLAEETLIIPPLTTMTIDSKCTVSNLLEKTGLGYISPRALGKRNVIMLEGIIKSKEPTFKVNISNFEEVPVTVQKGARIGFIWSATKISNKKKKEEKLSAMDRIRRIKFINEKYNISSNPLLNTADQRKLINLFLSNFNCVSTSPDDIGFTQLHTFDLKLLPGTKPFRCKPIKVNPDSEKALHQQINSWLSQGVIKEGDSPWSHPIFAVKKRAANQGESTLRWVLDFRRLNNVTERLAAPIPNIGDSLERLGNSKIFSVLDLTSAYHAMGMSEEAGKATAFCTKQKQYLFLRMPFGLTNAPASFCQLMAKVYELNPELIKFSLSYLDDIIVHSNTIDEHFVHLGKVLECLCEAGLKLNIGKCHLFSEEVKFLGHIISGQGISMDQEYLDKIAAWPLPVTGKDMQRYLGFLNYYSTYFHNFAQVTQPLNTLRNVKKIEWTEDLMNTFKETKELFCQQVKKAYPDWNAGTFILDTDFYSKAFGVVLSQIQDGKEVMINCTSKVCNEAERNYPSWKGELCALIHAFKRYTHILRYKPFIVRTDSTCLQAYKSWTKLDISGVAVRWLLYLQSFDFTIQYRPGKQHINADFLSRDMLATEIINTDIESIEGDNNLVDQIYNVNFSVKERRPVEIYETSQRLRSREWSKHTDQDDILKQVREFIINNTPPNSAVSQTLPYRAKQILKYFDNLRLVDGMIIFAQPLASGKIVERVVVPITLYSTVYNYAHNNRLSGHKGITETISKINRHFFMPYLQKFVEFQVANCIPCLNRKGKPRNNHTIERSVFSGEVLETVYMDHIGPITASSFKGKKVSYILILVDCCSRFTFAYPVEDCTVDTVVITIAEEFVPRHGLFKRIVSDQGAAFTAHVYNQLMEALNINKYYIPVRNPNSNPQERYNQGLIKYLKTDLTYDIRNWPKKLDYAVLCANTSFNRRLGSTPFFAFYGRDPILPIDLFNPLTTKFDNVNHRGFNKVIERIEEGWKRLRDNTSEYLRIQNLHRQDKPLEVNTICYIYSNVVKRGLSKKLQGFFLGPMIIEKKYSNSLYLVNPLDSCPIKNKKRIVVARDKLYPMDTKLELCPKEWISLDLQPSEFIHPDDCIMLDKKIFNNIDTYSGDQEPEYQADSLNQPEQESEPSAHQKTQSESSVSSAEISEQLQVNIPNITDNIEHSSINLEYNQRGESIIPNQGLVYSNKSSSSSIKSCSFVLSQPPTPMSVSSSSASREEHPPDELEPGTIDSQDTLESVEQQESGTSNLQQDIPGPSKETKKRGRGRPLGSVKGTKEATRKSERTNKRSLADIVNKRSIVDVTKSISNTMKGRLDTRRTSARAQAIENARNSRPGSRQENINNNE